MNLVFCAYANKEGFQSGHNTVCDDKQNVYLKNAFVALKSCKYYNPEDDVALVTNIELGAYWIDLFEKNNLLVLTKEFDDFLFEKDYGWSLAFYKLCALEYVLEKDYENYVLLDTDTYTQRPFEDIWVECKHNILMPEINRGLYNGDYRIFCEEAQKYLNSDEFITRVGGEFLAGNKNNLRSFMTECKIIYNRMNAEHITTINGDEFISSIAAWSMRDQVKSANAYVFRYWTAYRWHYVCSNYRYNPVCVLHCPREKEHGFLRLFKTLEHSSGMPRPSEVYALLHLDLLSYVIRTFTMKIRR